MDGAIAFADAKQAHVMQDDESRELYEMMQKAERDRRSEIDFAAEKRAVKIAQNALAKGATIEYVREITGLDVEAIAGLRDGA